MLIPILLGVGTIAAALFTTGCVALRYSEPTGASATYVRWGQQDIKDFEGEKTGPDGAGARVTIGSVQVAQPEILKPEQWNQIIENYIGAGLAESALGSLGEDLTGGGDISVEEIRKKLEEILKEKRENASPPTTPDDPADDAPPQDPNDWPDWPAGETRYHIYPDNNAAPNQRGLWKPDSDSRPGEPVMLLPAHMSKTGVAKVTVGGADVTNKVRKYPTDLLPILANGLRLHYNVPKVGANVPVVVTLSDGSEYRATVVNGTKRQDPLTFEKIKDADPGEDPPIIDDPDEDDPPVTPPVANNPRYAPGVVEIPAQFLKHGSFVELRFEKCSLANGLLKPTSNPLVFTLPPPSDEVWRWTDEQGRTPPRCIGTRAKFADGSLYDGFVYDYQGSYPMPISTTGRAFWVKMN